MKTVDPIASKLPAILAALPQDQPIVMLNLLKFRDEAMYLRGESPCSGREAYRRYVAIAEGMLSQVGGKTLYLGHVKGLPICPEDESWDEVMLVHYPSTQAFAGMLVIPEYRRATAHRTAALEDARLIATVQASGF